MSPEFHAYHHSVDPAHHNRNFSAGILSWDRLLGTDVREEGPVPERFGLPGMAPRSLLDTLVLPFQLLARQ